MQFLLLLCIISSSYLYACDTTKKHEDKKVKPIIEHIFVEGKICIPYSMPSMSSQFGTYKKHYFNMFGIPYKRERSKGCSSLKKKENQAQTLVDDDRQDIWPILRQMDKKAYIRAKQLCEDKQANLWIPICIFSEDCSSWSFGHEKINNGSTCIGEAFPAYAPLQLFLNVVSAPYHDGDVITMQVKLSNQIVAAKLTFDQGAYKQRQEFATVDRMITRILNRFECFKTVVKGRESIPEYGSHSKQNCKVDELKKKETIINEEKKQLGKVKKLINDWQKKAKKHTKN